MKKICKNDGQGTYEAENKDAEGAESVQDKADAKVLDVSDAVDSVPQEVSMCIQENEHKIDKGGN
jgi:hypothetical protein